MKSNRIPVGNDLAPPQRVGTGPIAPATWGSVLCFLAAVGYTATNICLRRLAALETDPMWATAMKEMVAVVVLGPWFFVQLFRGGRLFPSARWIGIVILSALLAQFAGNICQQWSFGVVGLAIAVPVIFSISLTGSAILAWLVLQETVPFRTIEAMLLLIAAILLLSFGAVHAGSLLPHLSVGKMLLGIGAACMAGASFAQLSLMLRMTSSSSISPLVLVFLVTGVGAGLLTPISLWRLGPSLLVQTTPEQWTYMAGAGSCNLLAFLAMTTGLRWTKVVRANVLNAAQVAMGAVAGILLFDEAWNRTVVLGVTLTILGVWFMGGPQEESALPGGSSRKTLG